MGQLLVVDGGPTSFEAGHRFQLLATTTVGRGPDNTIVIPDGFVSTTHAVLTHRDDGWWVSDVGSRNGTWVNDKRVDGEVSLQNGAILTLGQVKLKLAP